MDPTLCIRCDGSRLAKVRRTPQGFIRVDARLTRTGVLTYTRADGSIQRELRLPEDVFAAGSLATLAHAPVTDRHPEAMVTPANVRSVRVGGVGSVGKDATFVVAELQIEDAGAIAKIDSAELQELSCGYHCRLEPSPGVYQGQAYDAIQRDIVYNHVALGPKGWGRAGTDVRIRLDNAAVTLDSDPDAVAVQRLEDLARLTTRQQTREALTMIKVEGIEIKLDGAEAQTVEQAIAKRDAQIAKLETAATAAAKDLATVTAARDVLQGKLDSALSPAAVSAAVNARVAIETRARKVLGTDAKLDGKSEQEIHTETLAKACPELKLDGKSPDYVAAAFELVTAGTAAGPGAGVVSTLGNVNDSTKPPERTDSADPVEAARNKMIAARRAAAQPKSS